MTIDTTFYYRLTNEFSKSVLELSGSRNVHMAQPKPDGRQYWRFVLTDGRYRLCSAFLGDGLLLTYSTNPVDHKPYMTRLQQRNVGEQTWILEPHGNTYEFKPDLNLPHYLALNTENQAVETVSKYGLWNRHESVFRWTLTPVDKVIPDLDGGSEVRKSGLMTLGPTDYTLYRRPSGTIKAVMLFVDFESARGGDASAMDRATTRLLGATATNRETLRRYHELSYGKLTLGVTVKSDLGWIRMPGSLDRSITDSSVEIGKWKGKTQSRVEDQSQVEDEMREKMSQLFLEALSSPSCRNVDFREYEFVFLVTPETAGFTARALFPRPRAKLVMTLPGYSPNLQIKGGVVFGFRIYTDEHPSNRFIHEVGHLFGLPDLYPFPDYGVDPEQRVGCWSVMGWGAYSSGGFLGWERHTMGWLDPFRKIYLSENTSAWETKLSPLSENSGLSMVVLPLDDPNRPSKVLVVELAQPFKGADATPRKGEGVLLYSVDAKLVSGHSPVKILPRTKTRNEQYGSLDEAPFTLQLHFLI